MLPLLTDALMLVQALGAALGAAGVTFAELFYTRAVADGTIDTCEKKHILHTLWALRWGVIVVVLSGVALITAEYFLPNSIQTVLTAPFWMIHTLTVLVILLGFLISRSLIPWWIGSAGAFSAWWMMLMLHLWRNIPMNYLTLVIAYVLCTLIVAGAFTYFRSILREREQRSRA